MTAATDEEMERFYHDLSRAVKQVPKRDMLLVMGDFDAKAVMLSLGLVSFGLGLEPCGLVNNVIPANS